MARDRERRVCLVFCLNSCDGTDTSKVRFEYGLSLLQAAPALLCSKDVSGMERLNILPLAPLVGKPFHAFWALPTVAMVKWWLRSFVFRTADLESLTPLGHARSQASIYRANSSLMKSMIGAPSVPTIRVSHVGLASTLSLGPLLVRLCCCGKLKGRDSTSKQFRPQLSAVSSF